MSSHYVFVDDSIDSARYNIIIYILLRETAVLFECVGTEISHLMYGINSNYGVAVLRLIHIYVLSFQ